MKNLGNWQHFKSWGVRLAWVCLATLWLMLMATSWAEAAPDDLSSPGAASSSGDDEYNFNWLDPDKKIYVLQNRRYRKAGRMMLSVMAGPGLSNAYNAAFNIDPRIGFYLSEQFGFEAFYTSTSNTFNSTHEALLQAANTLPSVRRITSQVGALLHWSPWYSKINVFNKILYFDWYFSGGAGQVKAELDIRANKTLAPNFRPEEYFAVFLGTGHQFHLSETWFFRWDFTAAIYNAPISQGVLDKTWFTNLNFGAGIGVRL